MQYEEVKKDGGLAEVPPLPEDKYQLDNTPTIKVIKQKKKFFDVIKNMSTGIRKSIEEHYHQQEEHQRTRKMRKKRTTRNYDVNISTSATLRFLNTPSAIVNLHILCFGLLDSVTVTYCLFKNDNR